MNTAAFELKYHWKVTEMFRVHASYDITDFRMIESSKFKFLLKLQMLMCTLVCLMCCPVNHSSRNHYIFALNGFSGALKKNKAFNEL